MELLKMLLDLTVFDVYKKNSIKSITRENRGTGVRISVRKDTTIFKNFSKFMSDDVNKTELFQILADSMTSSEVFQGRLQITSTKASDIKCNISIDESVLSPCNHEEADTRIFLHVLDCIRNRFNEIKVITAGTDVVVIALGYFLSAETGEVMDRVWSRKTSQMASNPYLCQHTRRIKMCRVIILVRFHWMRHGFFISWKREENGLEYMEFVSRSYRGIY